MVKEAFYLIELKLIPEIIEKSNPTKIENLIYIAYEFMNGVVPGLRGWG